MKITNRQLRKLIGTILFENSQAKQYETSINDIPDYQKQNIQDKVRNHLLKNYPAGDYDNPMTGLTALGPGIPQGKFNGWPVMLTPDGQLLIFTKDISEKGDKSVKLFRSDKDINKLENEISSMTFRIEVEYGMAVGSIALEPLPRKHFEFDYSDIIGNAKRSVLKNWNPGLGDIGFQLKIFETAVPAPGPNTPGWKSKR